MPANNCLSKQSSDMLDIISPTQATLPEASKSCNELIYCGCKKGCRGQRKCVKAMLKCTALCACLRECQD